MFERFLKALPPEGLYEMTSFMSFHIEGQWIIVISTRRFLERPDAVSLEAMGFRSPHPIAEKARGSKSDPSIIADKKLAARSRLSVQLEEYFAV